MTGLNLDHAVICGEIECKTIFHYSLGRCPRCACGQSVFLKVYLEPKFQCSWCKRFYGAAKINGSHGICPECKELELAALYQSEERLIDDAKGRRWNS